jgi:DNA-binding LacI/PurR family transcriptional regulator
MERLKEERKEGKHVLMPPSLVVRSSTAPPGG